MGSFTSQDALNIIKSVEPAVDKIVAQKNANKVSVTYGTVVETQRADGTATVRQSASTADMTIPNRTGSVLEIGQAVSIYYVGDLSTAWIGKGSEDKSFVSPILPTTILSIPSRMFSTPLARRWYVRVNVPECTPEFKNWCTQNNLSLYIYLYKRNIRTKCYNYVPFNDSFVRSWVATKKWQHPLNNSDSRKLPYEHRWGKGNKTNPVSANENDYAQTEWSVGINELLENHFIDIDMNPIIDSVTYLQGANYRLVGSTKKDYQQMIKFVLVAKNDEIEYVGDCANMVSIFASKSTRGIGIK